MAFPHSGLVSVFDTLPKMQLGTELRSSGGGILSAKSPQSEAMHGLPMTRVPGVGIAPQKS
jgi:hypothetical protein